MTRPSAARWSSYGTVSATQARLVTSSTSCQRLELFSSGLNRRKFFASMFQFHHIAQEPAHLPRGLGNRRARRRDLDRIVAEVGQAQVAQQQAAVGVRVGAHAAGAVGASSASSGRRRPLSSNSSDGR